MKVFIFAEHVMDLVRLHAQDVVVMAHFLAERHAIIVRAIRRLNVQVVMEQVVLKTEKAETKTSINIG